MDVAGDDRGLRVEQHLQAAREAQAAWADHGIEARVRVLHALRGELASGTELLLASLRDLPNRSHAESLTAEILPLADACRFTAREAPRLLAPRPLGARGRPLWLYGLKAEIRREPKGVVLVIAPANYPLLIPGVTVVQALAAGNAVLIKPAPGCAAPMQSLTMMLARAGLPRDLVHVLAEDSEAAAQAIRRGVDHVALTGSADSGRAVLAMLAPELTSATMELSGSDAVFVLSGASCAMVADALAFGLRLNGGASCIAPRRVFVVREQAAALEAALTERLAGLPPAVLSPAVGDRLGALLAQAEAGGGRFIPGRPSLAEASVRPTAVCGADPAWALLTEDVFAPVLAMIAVDDADHALELNARSPYALGASIFGPEPAARQLAERVHAGSVMINDLIVPTADPRLPFGGRKCSGFGVMRGGEGLLELTAIKTVGIRRGRTRRHHAPMTAAHAAAAQALLRLTHGRRLAGRLRAAGALVEALRKTTQRPK